MDYPRELTHHRDDKVVLYPRNDSPIWQARLRIKDERTGKNKWHRISTKKRDITEAARIAKIEYDDIRSRQRHGYTISTKTVAYVAEKTIKRMESTKGTGNWREIFIGYIIVINKYITPFFEKNYPRLSIDAVNEGMMEELDVFRCKLFGGQHARSTISKHNTALRMMFDTACVNNWMKRSDVPKVKNNSTVDVNVRPFFTEDELEFIKEHLQTWCIESIRGVGRGGKTPYYRELLPNYCSFIGYCGNRPGREMVRLKYTSFAIKDSRGSNGEKKQVLTVEFFGKGKRREIVVDLWLKHLILRIANRFDELRDMSFEELIKQDVPVFRLRDGRQPKDMNNQLNKAFTQFLTDHDMLKDIRGDKRVLYSLRHSFCSHNILKGMDLHLLAKMMGNTPQMIHDFYDHVILLDKAEEIISIQNRGLYTNPDKDYWQIEGDLFDF